MLNFMAVNGTPLRQKFLIRGVVRHVLQDANDVNLVNGARMGSRDDFQLERLWPSHHFFSEEKRRRPVNYRMASYGYMPLKCCSGHLCCPELPCGTGQVLIFVGLALLGTNASQFPKISQVDLVAGKSEHVSGWWYTYPSEKYESVGMMKFPIDGKIIHSCSKPPTSISIGFLEIILHVLPSFSEIRG